MKKSSDMKVMLKEAGILFLITLLSGLILGFVYELTKGPIAEQKTKKVQQACAAVFEGADSFQEISFEADAALTNELTANGVKIGTVFEAKAADASVLGYVVQSTSTEGYGGNIVVFMGITKDGVLNDISLLEIKETPGLGMKAGEVLVPQFSNKQVESFTYTKSGSQSDSEIDAISGATVTTKAITNAVNGGLKVVQKLMQGGEANE